MFCVLDISFFGESNLLLNERTKLLYVLTKTSAIMYAITYIMTIRIQNNSAGQSCSCFPPIMPNVSHDAIKTAVQAIVMCTNAVIMYLHKVANFVDFESFCAGASCSTIASQLFVGHPHCGQLSNLSENCFPQSTHLSNPIVFHFTYFPPHGFSFSHLNEKRRGSLVTRPALRGSGKPV